MKQRSRYRRWVIRIAASLMAGVVLTVALYMAKVPWVKFTWDGILHDEPFCDGRPASYWIARYWRSPQDRLEAVRALSKRRDVTIPFLLGNKGDRLTADGQRIEILDAVILEMPDREAAPWLSAWLEGSEAELRRVGYQMAARLGPRAKPYEKTLLAAFQSSVAADEEPKENDSYRESLTPLILDAIVRLDPNHGFLGLELETKRTLAGWIKTRDLFKEGECSSIGVPALLHFCAGYDAEIRHRGLLFLARNLRDKMDRRRIPVDVATAFRNAQYDSDRANRKLAREVLKDYDIEPQLDEARLAGALLYFIKSEGGSPWDAVDELGALTSQSEIVLPELIEMSDRLKRDDPKLQRMTDLLRLMETNSGMSITLRERFGSVVSLSFRSGGKMLASSYKDHTIRLWDLETWKVRTIVQTPRHTIYGIAFSPNGKSLAWASMDEMVHLWDVVAEREKPSLKGHSDQVLAVAFNLTGDLLASASDDRTIKLWNVATGKEEAAWEAGYVDCLAFSPAGRLLASAGSDGTVKLWDYAFGKQKASLKGHAKPVKCISFSSDGKRLASGSDDGTVKLWDVATGAETATLNANENENFDRTEFEQNRNDPRIVAVAFSPDDKLVASANDGPRIKLWDAATGRLMATLRGHTRPVKVVAFGPDGKLLASGSEDGTVKLWNVASELEKAGRTKGDR